MRRVTRRRRRISFRESASRGLALFAAAIALYVLASGIRFLLQRRYLPDGTLANDIPVGGLTAEEAAAQIQAALANTITLRLDGSPILVLDPAQVSLQIDRDSVSSAAQNAIAGGATLEAFRRQLFFEATLPLSVSVPYRVNDAQLDAIIAGLAARYDLAATPDLIDYTTLRRIPGTPGRALAHNAMRGEVTRALTRMNDRDIELAMDIVPPEALSFRALRPGIDRMLAPFLEQPGALAAVFAKDLGNGEEFNINADVALSAQGWMRLPVALAALADGANTGALGAVLDGSQPPDGVLATLGGGDAQMGADTLNSRLAELGLTNSFIAQPYGIGGRPPTIVTPANSRGDIDAAPNPLAQSTAADIGLLLEMLEQCRVNRGALALAWSGRVAPSQCETLLTQLRAVSPPRLLAVAQDAETVQRQSWDTNTHGVAGIVRTPRGAYVLVVALHSTAPLTWPESSVLISEVARLIYARYGGEAPPPVQAVPSLPP